MKAGLLKNCRVEYHSFPNAKEIDIILDDRPRIIRIRITESSSELILCDQYGNVLEKAKQENNSVTFVRR